MAIAAQFQKLLDSCREMEFSHLRPLVDRMFENADVALLDFAEKAESNVAQSTFFEAMNEVRKKRSVIEQHLYAEIKRGFAEFPSPPQSQDVPEETGLSSLSLVATDEVETYVATQNASGKLASRIMDRIFALKQRLTVLNGGNAIQENEIPGGPAWLGAAFQHAVEQLELENKVRLVFIALFDKFVLNHAQNLFDEYNKLLIEADILPNLRYEVRKQAGGVEIIEREISDAEAEEELTGNASTIDAEPQTPSELGDELFGRICELMSGQRARRSGGGAPGAGSNISPIHGSAGSGTVSEAGAGGTGGGEAGAGGGEGGAGATLVSQISRIQSAVHTAGGGGGLPSSEFIENIEIDDHLIDRLKNTLDEERNKIFGAIDRRQIPAADTNVIELVGMMFEYMLKDEHLPNVVKALLSRLHTPLLKVAVVDKSFFTHQGHPARKLLNDMTAAGIRWVEETEIDRGIFPKMQEIVDQVLLDFKEDVSLFEKLLEDFTTTVDELDQRANMVEKRTNEAASGQEKLQAARARAQREVHIACQGKPIDECVHDFLQRIWADKLTFILLRNEEGEESEDWKTSVELAETLAKFAYPPATQEEQAQRRDELPVHQKALREACNTLHQADKEKLLGSLFRQQADSLEKLAAPPEPAAEVAEAPDASANPEEVMVDEDEPSQEQLEMIEELKRISFGTWFEFQKPGKPKKRAKLSWRSTVTEKFMFVDQMGVKAAVVSMHDLADCMLDGSVRIAPAEKRPFVDRALNAIHRMLDHAA